MRQIFRKIALVLALFLSACSVKNYEHTESKIIIIKSPHINFADLAYVRHSGDAVGIELFSAGKMIQKIEINQRICVVEGCVSKESFNAKYLSPAYPQNILQNIILAKPIYKSRNIVRKEDGFSQRIVTDRVNIRYEVNQQKIFFKDKSNKIIIKIKDMHE